MSRPCALILLYHRVAGLRTDPQLLAVAPERFAEHARHLRRTCAPLSLARLHELAAADRLPERAVALTFDDGYADNLDAARILAGPEIPATVFVASGFVAAQREFWWDELERILLLAPDLPRTLEARVDNEDLAWDLGQDQSLDAAALQSLESWNVTRPETPTARHAVYRDLSERLKRISAAHRRAVLDDLARQARSQAPRPSHLPLSRAQVQDLVRDGLVEAGGHTVHHSRLSALSEAEERAEILGGKQDLEEMLGRPQQTFSYPYGGRRDYLPRSAEAARQAGYLRACSNFPGLVRGPADLRPFELPRFLVRDWPLEVFAARLENWFSGKSA